jgi:hypothetical protein
VVKQVGVKLDLSGQGEKYRMAVKGAVLWVMKPCRIVEIYVSNNVLPLFKIYESPQP